MILGIIFPPLILLLDFRLGDDASFHAPGGKEEGKDKEDDNKSSKVSALLPDASCAALYPVKQNV